MIIYSRGFIAVTSVLILSAIFLSITISIASRAITVTDTSITFRERDAARYIAHACKEYARIELQRTLDYQGDEVISVGDESCEILSIDGSGNADRILRVQSFVGSHGYYIEDNIEAVSPYMIITTTERVSQF